LDTSKHKSGIHITFILLEEGACRRNVGIITWWYCVYIIVWAYTRTCTFV